MSNSNGWVDRDTGKHYLNFGTGEIKNPPYDVIDLSTTGYDYPNKFLHGASCNGSVVGEIKMLSPSEYFYDCATKIIGNIPVDTLKAGRGADKVSINNIKTVILKFKRQLPLPYINYNNGSQEGLHRMYVLGDVYGWDVKFPVLVITNRNRM